MLTDAIAGKKVQTSLQNLFVNARQSFYNMMLQGLTQNLNGFFDENSSGNIVVGLVKSVIGLFKADGGSVTGDSTYIVGERGPEVFVPNTSGTIIPNHRLTVGSAKESAPQVTVNVINNSGQQVSAKQESHFDGQRYVVDVWLDALARNVGGVRDVLYAGGR